MRSTDRIRMKNTQDTTIQKCQIGGICFQTRTRAMPDDHHLPTPKETVEDFWRAYFEMLKATQTPLREPAQEDDDSDA